MLTLVCQIEKGHLRKLTIGNTVCRGDMVLDTLHEVKDQKKDLPFCQRFQKFLACETQRYTRE